MALQILGESPRGRYDRKEVLHCCVVPFAFGDIDPTTTPVQHNGFRESPSSVLMGMLQLRCSFLVSEYNLFYTLPALE
jgi:hypothetical protein